MCTCSIFVCRHKNNDMSTLLGHAHTYIPTDRQTDTQAYIHQSIQTYSYTHRWLHMCDLSPLWGGGWGGTRGAWIIYIVYIPSALNTCYKVFRSPKPTPKPFAEGIGASGYMYIYIILFKFRILPIWQLTASRAIYNNPGWHWSMRSTWFMVLLTWNNRPVWWPVSSKNNKNTPLKTTFAPFSFVLVPFQGNIC